MTLGLTLNTPDGTVNWGGIVNGNFNLIDAAFPVSVANGGTGLTALTAQALLYAASSSSVGQLVLPSSGNQIVSSNNGNTAVSYQTLTTLLDNIFGSTQGMTLRRGAAAWTALGLGTANQVLTSNGTDVTWAAVPGGSSGLPTGYTRGLNLVFASGTTVTVQSGKARDKSDTADITLASDTTIDITTAGAGGLDTKTSAATISTTGASVNATTSASIVSELGTRNLTGTMSSAAGVVTGVGTKFLAEVNVGALDMIGNSTVGYSRIATVTSDTVCTVVGFPGGNMAASSSAVAIEAPLLLAVANNDVRWINTLTAAGTTITVGANWSATNAGQTLKLGPRTATGLRQWYAVWIGTGGSGTTVFASTQRTTPYGVTGYNTSVRRIGWIKLDTSVPSAIPQFSSVAISPFARDCRWEVATAASETQVVSNATATSWTDAQCFTAAPPSCRRVYTTMSMTNVFGPTLYYLYLRERNISNADTSLSRNQYVWSQVNNQQGTNTSWCGVDGNQYLQFVMSAGGNNPGTQVYVLGYEDLL